MSAAKRHPVDVVPSIVLGVILLIVWEGIVRLFHVSNFVIPSPSEISRRTSPLPISAAR